MVLRPLLAAAAVVVVVAAACGSGPAPAPAAAKTASPRALAGKLPGLELPQTLQEVDERQAVTGIRDRAAVIVVADRYRQLPSYDVPQVMNSAAALRESLVESCGVPVEAIELLAEARAIPQEVEAAVRRLAGQLGGSNPLLMVIFTGHGVVDAAGELQLFTHYTTRGEAGAYDRTMPRRELLGWLAQARSAARGRGMALETLLVVDACRTPTLGAPPAAKLVTQDTWELYSAESGQFADAPPGQASPFARALATSLAALSERGMATLRDVFLETRRQLSGTGTAQAPQLVVPGDDQRGPALVRPPRVRVGFAVIDSLAAAGLDPKTVTVRADDVQLDREGDLFVIETAPDRMVQLQADCPGFLPFSRRVSFSRRQNGKAFTLPLLPGFVRIVGRVAPAVPVEVVAGSDDDGAAARDGYHRLKAFTSSEDGGFELRLPPLDAAAVTEVVFRQNDRELLVLPVAAADLIDDGDVPGARRKDLGTVALENADVSALPTTLDLDALSRMAARTFGEDAFGGIRPPRVFAEPDLRRTPQFTDTFQRITWEEALAAYQRDDLELARTHLVGLVRAMAPRNDVVVQALAGHVEITLAERAETDLEVQQQIDRADPGDGLLASGLRAILAARKLRKASTLARDADVACLELLAAAAKLEPTAVGPYARSTRERIRDLRLSIATDLVGNLNADRRHADVLAVVQRLQAEDPAAWNHPSWAAVQQRMSVTPLEQNLRQALEQIVATGDAGAADEAIALRRKVFPADAPAILTDLETAIARERIPLSCRRAYEAAEAARVAGRVDEALQRYTEAAADANDHYRNLIAERRRDLRESTYRAELRRAAELRTAGDLGGALAAFLAASRARGRLHLEVKNMLDAHPELRTQQVDARLAELDRMQLEAARQSRSRAEWQAYLEDHPSGEGAAEAAVALRRLANPWQPVTPAAGTQPLPRFGHAMSYDAARGVVVMFGGATAAGDDVRYLADTWTWDGEQWRQAETAAAPRPRAFHAMVWDEAHQQIVLFGGTADADLTGMSDTWVWDGRGWSPTSGGASPPARCQHAMAFDPRRGRVVLFGGYKRHRDTWEWDGSRWTVIDADDDPGDRWNPAMAFDPQSNKVVLCGGDGRDADTWLWDGRGWARQKTRGIVGLDGAAMAPAPGAAKRLLMVAGSHRGDATADTYAWNGTSWQKLALGRTPPPRAHHAVVYDQRRGVLLLFGGGVPGRRGRMDRVFGDLWELYLD